ncbi:bifunctional glycosyltransferase family 2 protein/CDP-glycerol:glycerophosphate glycerophosphotransferase [Nicoliella spurrieriana]|uniref:Bifunctional glycosyltransferase family 2 protein/CDP-glycerol:glycerophosphate glycerophosphotransferase n=1 Tax=Nicoliella spurrieriana TaxID=2925830 RepID=A0A976X589_9LACO|nr:bifunctional glycosyltransferase family 2 protein/CDP-glycerol:glycerophosphate glycerophosphotransferase [Nicoliella spurrieriana]UQS86519.1 bifunctional glycosyltransferase family 2 protein/CDP-glycerol:glycerophosphate glycerophosphotransferase [Nicoliella spurrieriana]
MKFSIITPCKADDLERLSQLKANLESQTFKRFEWIIACNDFNNYFQESDFPTQVVPYKPDTIGAARNAALDAAIGDYIVFIDADDFLMPNAFKNLNHMTPRNASTIIDLNHYKTYETQAAFLKDLEINQRPADSLPDWGGKKKRKPRTHSLNLMPADLKHLGLSKKADRWLTNKYNIYSGETRYDQLSGQLVLAGKVIERQFLLDTEVRFDTENDLYSDIQFMMGILNYSKRMVKVNEPQYITVYHNDPINDPSNAQLVRNDRWQLMVAAWIDGYQNLTNDRFKLAFAEYTLKRLNRYLYNSILSQRDSIGDVDTTLHVVSNYLQLIDKRALSSVNIVSRKIINALINQNYKLAKRLMVSLVFERNARTLLRSHGRGITKQLYQSVFTRMPIQSNVIFYESFLGRNYSDNPKYIYEYIQKHYPGKYQHVWSASTPMVSESLDGQPDTTVVKRFGFKYMYYLATSKFQVFNLRQPRWFVKRPGTKLLSTWHGTPLKRLVFDIDNVVNATPMYKRNFYEQSRQWDYLIAPNQFSADVFSHAFMYPQSKMIKSGYPRNDILNAPDRDQRAIEIKQRLGIPLDKKVILYAPTWRDDERASGNEYKFQLRLNVAKLRENFGDDYVMILRTHYFITDRIDTTTFGDFVYNESNYQDVSELYLVSDILITDYSSVFFDYSILKRPILYFVYDYDNYAKVLHGFYLDMQKDLPGPLLKTNDELVDAIKNIDQIKQKYAQRYQKFDQRFDAWENGNASEQVVNVLLNDSNN